METGAAQRIGTGADALLWGYGLGLGSRFRGVEDVGLVPGVQLDRVTVPDDGTHVSRNAGRVRNPSVSV